MLVVAMVVAACVGVVQMHVLASPTRSVRLGLVLACVPAGVYGATALALGLQLAAVRVWTAVADQRRPAVIELVGYTAGPVIEELAKLAPLLVIGLALRARRQWGFTDHVLLGGGLGAGFGLMEALLRFSTSSIGPLAWHDGGWALPISVTPPYVPGIRVSLRGFLPAPAGPLPENLQAGTITFEHLVWSAVAGLGLGLLLRGRRWWWRAAGLVPVALAAADHMASNYEGKVPRPTGAAARLADGVTATDRWLWVWAVAALMVAMALDRRALVRRAGRASLAEYPELLLAGEREVHWRPAGLARLAVLRLPWSLLVVHRFVLVRRAAWHSGDADLMAAVAELRGQLDAGSTREAWRALEPGRLLWDRVVPPGPGRRRRVVRRLGLVLLLLALLAPAAIYHARPLEGRSDGIKGWFVTPGGLRAATLAMVAGLVWVGWRVAVAGRDLRRAHGGANREPSARLALQVCTGLGSLTFGALALRTYLTLGDPNARLVAGAYLLNALLFALLVTAIVVVTLSTAGVAPAVVVAGGGLTLLDVLLFGTAAQLATGPTVRSRGQVGIQPQPSFKPPVPKWQHVVGPLVAIGGLLSYLKFRHWLGHVFGGGGTRREAPPLFNPEHYVDSDGVVRWRDTQQSVEQVPNRSKYEDDDGIWRWSDTRQPTDSLHQDGALSAQPPDPEAETDDHKKRAIELENESAAEWKAEGKEVFYVVAESKVPPRDRHGNTPPNPSKRPDDLVAGEFRDVYSPRSSNAANVLETLLQDKIKVGQTQRVDIKLDPGRSGTLTAADLRRVFDSQFRTLVEGGDYDFVRPSDGVRFPPVEITVSVKGVRTVIYRAGGG